MKQCLILSKTEKMTLLRYYLTVFLIIRNLQFTFGNEAEVGYIPCRQSKINGTYQIDCSNLNLKSVPKCESLNVTDCTLVTDMNLRRNNIKTFSSGSFMQYPNLVHIWIGLDGSKIFENGAFTGLEGLESLIMKNMTPDGGVIFANETFAPLVKLKYLDLSNSLLHVQNVFKTVLCSVSATLETLLMDYIFLITSTSFPQFVVLDGEMSKCLYHMNLKKLSLGDNNIVEITPEFLVNLRHIEYLSLRYNIIIGDSAAIPMLGIMHNLTFFDLGCQNNWQCNKKYVYPPNIPNFQEESILFQSKPNEINGIEVQTLPKLRTIRTDHLGGTGNVNHKLPDICWSNNHLVELDWSHQRIETINGSLKCMWNLKFFNIRGWRASYLDPMLFEDMISLKVLLLGGTFLPNKMSSQDFGRKLFDKNKDLIYLELSQNGIDSLHSDVFRNLYQLRFLNLSNNQIQHVDNAFENLTTLEQVDISYNDLTQVPMILISVLERNMKMNSSTKGIINITGNPFQCSCTLMSEITRVQMSEVKVISLNSTQDKLNCILQNGTRIPFSEVRKQLESICHVNELTPIVFLTFVYPLSLILITLSTFGYKYRWRVKLAWYTVLHLFYNKEQERSDFRFDAFISYCSHDEDWVRKKLVANLEKENNKYKLCLHYRHFIPGRCITDNITAAVQKSRKTVLVVTKKYLKSGWCDFETRFAQTHHLHEHTGGVIGIIHPEVFHIRGARGMALDRLLDSVTYINWPIEKEKEALFWFQLKRALGPPRTVQAANNDAYDMLIL